MVGLKKVSAISALKLMNQNFLHYCMVEITVQSKKRIEFIDVTAKVREIVTSSGVANGRVYL